VLLVYLQLAKVVRGLTPPTKEDLQALMKKVSVHLDPNNFSEPGLVCDQIDMEGKEELDLEEFTALTSLLLGNIAGRIVVQLVLTLVVIPLIATILMTVLCLIYRPNAIWTFLVPKGLPTTILAAILTMLVMPRMLDLVGERFRGPIVTGVDDDDKKND
jgi:hypothetical protein